MQTRASAFVLAGTLFSCGGSTVTEIGSQANDGGLTDDGATAPADASTEPARPTQRSLGTVTAAQSSNDCSQIPNATCQHVTVQCPGIAELGATVAVQSPTAPKATLVGFSGGGGDTFYDHGTQQLAQTGAYRIVLVKWDSDWETTADAGILAAACRPSTILEWAFEEIHASDRAQAFCAAGASGGSAQVSYALAHYGRAAIVDFAALTAGPPFGRIDYGCAPSTYSGPPRELCPLLPDAVLPLPPDRLNAWENTTTCGASAPSVTELAKWKADSVVSPGATFDYPQTNVELFDCTNQPNGTTGGAYFLASAITSSKAVYCFDGPNDGCRGEGLGKGIAKLVSEIEQGCVPRHQK